MRAAAGEARVGEVKVEIELENLIDRERAQLGELSEREVRAVRAPVLVDTGSVMLMLPQDLIEALGLRELGKAIVSYADERKEERPIAGYVLVRVLNRSAALDCVVGPPNSEPLLGQIALEGMDLLVDCTEQRLIPRPESPFLPLFKLK